MATNVAQWSMMRPSSLRRPSSFQRQISNYCVGLRGFVYLAADSVAIILVGKASHDQLVQGAANLMGSNIVKLQRYIPQLLAEVDKVDAQFLQIGQKSQT
jgi:hypothetical protein